MTTYDFIVFEQKKMRDKSGSNAALSDNNGEGSNNGGDNENAQTDGGIAEDTEVELETETDVENGVLIRGDGKGEGKVKEQETKSERGLYIQTETEDLPMEKGERQEGERGLTEGQRLRDRDAQGQGEGQGQGETEVVSLSQTEREIRYQQGLLASTNLPNPIGLTNIPYTDIESGSGKGTGGAHGQGTGQGQGLALGAGGLGYGISADYHDPDPIIDLYNKQQRLLMQCQSSRSQTTPANDYIPSKAKADNAISSGFSSSSSSSSNTSTSSYIEFYADQYAASDDYSVLELNTPPSLYPTRHLFPPPIKTKNHPTHATNGQGSNGQKLSPTNLNPGPRSVSQIQMDSPRNKVSVWGKKGAHSPVMGSWVNGIPVISDREKDKKRDSEGNEKDREKSDKERETHSNGYTNGNGISNGTTTNGINGTSNGKKTNGIYKTEDEPTDHYTLLFPKPDLSPPQLRHVPGGYRSTPQGDKTHVPPPRNPFLPSSPKNGTTTNSFSEALSSVEKE